nr:hypothetical protein [uncultured Shinella sp.]
MLLLVTQVCARLSQLRELLPAALGSKVGSFFKPTARAPVEIDEVNWTH